MSIDGKPVIPVMGEFHFTRYPRAQWEQEIVKMKAGGVNVLPTIFSGDYMRKRKASSAGAAIKTYAIL